MVEVILTKRYGRGKKMQRMPELLRKKFPTFDAANEYMTKTSDDFKKGKQKWYIAGIRLADKNSATASEESKMDKKRLQELAGINEKWAADYKVKPSEKGKYADKSIEELLSMKKNAKGDKLKEINFAIRAKRAKGGKWAGVTTEGMAHELTKPSVQNKERAKQQHEDIVAAIENINAPFMTKLSQDDVEAIARHPKIVAYAEDNYDGEWNISPKLVATVVKELKLGKNLNEATILDRWVTLAGMD